MFKKTMTFEDLEGNERTETFYFHYNKKELAELIEFGQIEERLKKLMQPTSESGLSELANTQQAYDFFQEIILGAYGEKGEDNVTFIKNERTKEYFENHVAYVELIFEMIQNPDLAAKFIEQCVPEKLMKAAKAEMEQGPKNADLQAMIDEAARRQQDPETRIEPGPEAAAAALGTDVIPPVAKEKAPVRDPKTLTEADIMSMTDEEFSALDVRKLSQDQLLVAFRRRSVKG